MPNEEIRGQMVNPKDDSGGTVAGTLFPAVLMIPSVVWVVEDRSIWSWDPAFYAMDSVDLWHRLTQHPGQWLGRMQTVFGGKTPGLAWLGQFFVPVGLWIGSIDRGLLVFILITQFLALAIFFRVAVVVAPSGRWAPAAGTLMIAGAPLFVGMSHHYLTEALQMFSVVYVLWVAVGTARRSPLRNTLHLVAALLLGILVKLGTPAVMAAPALLIAYRIVGDIRSSGGRKRSSSGVSRGDMAFAGVELAMGILAAGWFTRNGATAVAFAKLSASSDVALNYGRRAALSVKLLYWLGAMGRTLATPTTAMLLIGGGAMAAWIVKKRKPTVPFSGEGSVVYAALLQVALVVLVTCLVVNEETRYLLPLAPYLALVMVRLLHVLGSRRAAMGTLALLGLQWATVNGRELGLLKSSRPDYWQRPPGAESERERDLRAAVAAACSERMAGRTLMVAVDLDWMNRYTLQYFSNQGLLRGEPRCYFTNLGYAPKDPDEALALLERSGVSVVVSLEPRALAAPPDFLNQVALSVTKRVAADPRYRRVPLQSANGIAIYRREDGG